MSVLFPEIVDKSTLTGVFQSAQFMTIGVEGQMDAGGTADIANPILCRTADDADTAFGPASSLASLVKYILAQGVEYVWAVASASGTVPTLIQRQAAWANLEDNPDVRIRLTDSAVQEDIVALADSCEFAEGIQNKQFCVVGMPSPAVKATTITVAGAIASKRAVLVDPAIYDNNGNLLAGQYGAAKAATAIALNPDIMDSMNDMSLPATGGIETDPTSGLPIYRQRANAGSPVNDFADLLAAGVSPFMQAPDGRAAFTHLRTTYTVDSTFDALTTLLVKDQLFINIRNLLRGQRFLREGNTATNRALAAKLVDQYLKSVSDWVEPVELADGTTGYGVTVVASSDLKSFTVNYFGQIVRGTNVININGTLTIPA